MSQKELSEITQNGTEATKPVFSRRRIIIDPAFVLFFAIQISSFSLAGQYIYFAIGEQHNLTAVLEDAAKNLQNETGGDSGTCGATNDRNASAYILQQKVQAEAANFNLFLDMFSEIPGFFLILFFGTLMDKLGRRPTLLIPLVGVFLRALIYALQQLLNLPLYILAVAHLTDAVCGGIATFMTSCYAYYADTVPAGNRGYRLAIVDVFQTFGLAGMQIGMGFMIQSWGYLWPYVTILGGHLLNIFYVFFFVPESRPSTGATWRDISPTYVFRSFKILPKKRPNNGRSLLLIFVVCWSIVQFGCMARHNIETLYKLNSPFCWESTLIGSFNGMYYVLTCFTQMVLTIFVLKRVGEMNMLVGSIVSWIVYFIVQALATTTLMLFLSAVLGTASGLQVPMQRGKLSQLVSAGEQGALFSTVSAIDNLLRIAGSAFINPLYGYTLVNGIFKGTAFLVLAGIVTIGLVILIVFMILEKKAKKKALMKQLESKENEVDAVYSIRL